MLVSICESMRRTGTQLIAIGQYQVYNIEKKMLGT